MNGKIEQLVKGYAGEAMDLCYCVLEILNQEDRPEEGLAYFYESIRSYKTECNIVLEQHFSKDELQEWELKYANYINNMLLAYVNKAHEEKWTKEKFYSILWKRLNADCLFEDIRQRAFVLFKFGQSALMPYVEFGTPLSMDNEKFQELFDKNRAIIDKMRHIMALNFTQKTEIVSLMLGELQSVDTFEEKCVILSVVLDDYTQDKLRALFQMFGNIGVQAEQGQQ